MGRSCLFSKYLYVAKVCIGHALETHIYLLNRDYRPTCRFCSEALTVKHVLVTCPRLSAERDRHFSLLGSDFTSPDILGDDSEAVHTGQVFFFQQLTFVLVTFTE